MAGKPFKKITASRTTTPASQPTNPLFLCNLHVLPSVVLPWKGPKCTCKMRGTL